jgi:DNA-directed RNA polymerase subunit RPC12/RpoP
MPPTPEHTRDLYLRRTFGITLEEYKAILAAQGHRCPICNKPLEGISNPVDHDHKTNVVRGIPCTYCNRRRIAQHTDWEMVQRIADYLKHHPAHRVIGPRRVPPKKRKASGSGRRQRKDKA